MGTQLFDAALQRATAAAADDGRSVADRLYWGVLDSAAARGEIDLTGLRAAEIADVALALNAA